MPWFILRETVDTTPIDGTNRRRALCGRDLEHALGGLTLQGVEATATDIAPSDGLRAIRYAEGKLTFEEARACP